VQYGGNDTTFASDVCVLPAVGEFCRNDVQMEAIVFIILKCFWQHAHI